MTVVKIPMRRKIFVEHDWASWPTSYSKFSSELTWVRLNNRPRAANDIYTILRAVGRVSVPVAEYSTHCGP